LHTDHGENWSDEQIVLAYRAQHHVEADFRCLKNPYYLSFRPTFHWTDQKLRVHACYCVLALMILNLLRRQRAQSDMVISTVETMKQLTETKEVSCSIRHRNARKKPWFAQLSKLSNRQQQMVSDLDLDRYLSR